MKPVVHAGFDETTFTVSYVAHDPGTKKAAVIDSVLDYDPASGRTDTRSAEAIVDYVKANGLTVEWIIETHVHADHLSAAQFLKQKLGGGVAVGEKVPLVQKTFGRLFNAEAEFVSDGRQFDRLFADGEMFMVGDLEARAVHTPGHTPACVSYVIGDTAFVGDTLFMPDYGTARCDFPGGDAATLFRSIQKIFALPDRTRVFTCHDYKAPGRDEFAWESTIAEQKKGNVHVGGGASEETFVRMRKARDATLCMPALLLPAVQVNMRAGALPPPEENGVSYLKIPINAV